MVCGNLFASQRAVIPTVAEAILEDPLHLRRRSIRRPGFPAHDKLCAAKIKPIAAWSRAMRNYFQASTTAPNRTNAPPIQCCNVSFSCRNKTASAIAKTTLSLSTGATRDASPSCNARK